mgnify:CR=1 FL=1
MNSLRYLPLLAALLWIHDGRATVTVNQQIIGPANAGGWYVFSPGGGHVGYAGNRGTRVGVTVDGIEGPTFDELYTPHGASFMSPPNIAAMTASPGGRTNQAAQGAPIIMSSDGSHYAYAGRQGEEYVVIHDGKEVARGPRTALSLNYNPLTLSPGGRHVYWNETTGTQGARWLQRLVIDGKPGPWSGHQDILPVFSPDDSRYAYTYISPEDANQRVLIVDGKPAGYKGVNPIFTADSKQLITLAQSAVTGLQGLLVDGKLRIKTHGVRKVVPAPVGGNYAAIAFKEIPGSAGVYMLYLNGKEIPGTENVKELWFSPDGKHYAAAVENKAARSMFMVIDGKEQREYQGVNTNVAPVWFADNSQPIYLVTGGGRSFVVVGEHEFEISYLGGNMIETQGTHYAYHTYDGSNLKHSLIIDGKEVLLPGFYPRGYGLSPNGERHAYQASRIGRSDVAGMVVDGKMLDNFFPHEFGNSAGGANSKGLSSFRFSPDSRHLALLGGNADPNSVGLYVDNSLVYPTRRGLMNLIFTPDSKHLAWLTSEVFPDRPQAYQTVYLNGERVLKLGKTDLLRIGGAWDMGSDGVLTLICEDGDRVKRFRITPDPDMNIAKWISDAEENFTKAQAAKATREKQASEDAAVAKARADADRAAAAAKGKADAEAAAAKRKADYEAAVAAKQKAYQEAVEAKRQARLLQLENAKRARQGLPPLKKLPAQ